MRLHPLRQLLDHRAHIVVRELGTCGLHADRGGIAQYLVQQNGRYGNDCDQDDDRDPRRARRARGGRARLFGDLGAEPVHQFFLRSGVLACADSARGEVVIELAFLIAIDGRCGIELGRRSVLPRFSASKQGARENDQCRGDERERNEPEQHDGNHEWRRGLS